MKNTSLKMKILTGLLTGGMYLSSVSITYATTVKPLYINEKAPLTNEFKQIDPSIQLGLQIKNENLLNTKNITQDEANKIKAVLNKSESMKKVNTGITKTLAKQEHKVHKDGEKIKRINPIITLLDNGTITETQAEKILMKQIYLYHARMVES
jgi:Asp-tRNA(Asn)/Glu-tRNA(Gln) amidotransferase B subunit